MYFKNTIQYVETNDQGFRKLVSEQYLTQSVDWVDAQTTITKELADARSEFMVKGIVPLKLSDIIFAEPEETDVEDWYLCKVEFVTENDKGKEKRIPQVMLVNAKSVPDANTRILDHLKTMLIPYEVKKVDKSKILEVFLVEKTEA